MCGGQFRGVPYVTISTAGKPRSLIEARPRAELILKMFPKSSVLNVFEIDIADIFGLDGARVPKQYGSQQQIGGQRLQQMYETSTGSR